METYNYYAGGAWHEPLSGDYFESHDPAIGRPWALIPNCDVRDVELAVSSAHTAFGEAGWQTTNAVDRGRMLRRIGDVVARNADRLGRVETRDNGKKLADITSALNGWLTDIYYYYGGLADKSEGSVIPVDTPGMLNITKHIPYGVVGGATAWNSPLLLAAWKIAPALVAGNTIVLKPSEFASASTLELMKVLEEADLPLGLINVVTGFCAQVGVPLVNHPLVRKISFTGSVPSGSAVAAAAAKQIKSVTMELGGKSPQIIFEDADIESALDSVVDGIFLSTGQSCSAGPRLLLHENIHYSFLDRLVEKTAALRIGEPMDIATDVGPISNGPHFERVLADIENSAAAGARLVFGGNSLDPDGRGGWYIEPTIFAGVTSDMRLAQHEVFGPVIALMRFRDEEEAVTIANGTDFGLDASIWTEDYRRALSLSDRIEAGTVYINSFNDSCASSPLGGCKQSGYGRENGIEGLREYMQVKSVWINSARN